MNSSIVDDVLCGGTVALRRISFCRSTVPDVHVELLKTKYITVNPATQNKKRDDHKKNQGKQETLSEELSSPNYELFPDENVSQLLYWQDVKRIGAGLLNLGNTCFLNSALQCLTYTPPLANYAISKGHSKSCRTVGVCLFCELEKQIIHNINSTSPIAPRSVVGNLKRISKHFKVGRQEDSHEFLRYLIDGIQKCCLEGIDKKLLAPRVAETTIVHKIFGGYLQSQVKCKLCGYQSNTFDPFLDLSLEIQGTSVESCLAKFTRPETLDHDNKYKCPSCRKLVQAEKRFTIKKPPNVLTIQLKRFTFTSFFGGKIDKLVTFQEYLDLAPYVSENKSNYSVNYSLYAVLVHSGSSTRSGHYYSFVKSSSGTWYCMDDNHLQQVSLGTVLKQKAYMLFYLRNIPVTAHKPQKRPLESIREEPVAKHQKTLMQPEQIKQSLLSMLELSSFAEKRQEPTNVVTTQPKSTKFEPFFLEDTMLTWDGKQSKTSKQTTDAFKTSPHYDQYDQFLDRGKTKKVKARRNGVYHTNVNPFQHHSAKFRQK